MFHKKKIIYFAPHQDDELLTMGIDICTSISKNQEVYVVLCTDGSKSNVRKILNNGKTCSKHEGVHHYELSTEEFIQARDREFLGSCLALGVPAANVHLPEKRAIDGSLSVGEAENILRTYLSQLGEDAVVCTISPNNGPAQHRDHKALGIAAENLLNKGVIRELKLFIEPYHSKKVFDNPRLLLDYPHMQRASGTITKKIREATASYSCWNPAQKQYAVGYHSVTTEFNDFLQEMISYWIVRKPWEEMNILNKMDLRYHKWLKLQKQNQLYYSLKACSQPDLGELSYIVVQAGETADYEALCKQYNLELRDKDLQRLTDGSSFWCLEYHQEIVSTGWLAYQQKFYIAETDYRFDMKNSSSGILYDFNTKLEHRGHGYYGKLLQTIVHNAEGPKKYVIYTAPDNTASAKGIIKAGFHYDGTLSASDNSMKGYLQREGFTSITRKNRLWGMKVKK